MDDDRKFDDQYNDPTDTINDAEVPRDPEPGDEKPVQDETTYESAYEENSAESDSTQEPLNEPEQDAAMSESDPVQPQPPEVKMVNTCVFLLWANANTAENAVNMINKNTFFIIVLFL